LKTSLIEYSITNRKYFSLFLLTFLSYIIQNLVMNSHLLASIAIVAAMALVGAAVVSSIPIFPQQAFADKPWGCDKKSNADENSGGNCSHKGHRGN
jgi:hypothetical protein